MSHCHAEASKTSFQETVGYGQLSGLPAFCLNTCPGCSAAWRSPCTRSADVNALSWILAFACSDPTQFSNVYFIKKEAGEWTYGSIVSDSSVAIIGFSETTDVSRRASGIPSLRERVWLIVDTGGRLCSTIPDTAGGAILQC